MTDIIIEKQQKSITKVICDGHTGFGEAGEDIVCAALSSIVQTALLGLLTVVRVDVKYRRDEKDGFLEFTLPQNLNERQRHDADIVLETMLCGVSDLYEEYSDYLNLEVK